jgi:hypothetical protein
MLSLLAAWNLCTYAFVWMAVTPGLGSNEEPRFASSRCHHSFPAH